MGTTKVIGIIKEEIVIDKAGGTEEEVFEGTIQLEQ